MKTYIQKVAQDTEMVALLPIRSFVVMIFPTLLTAE